MSYLFQRLVGDDLKLVDLELVLAAMMNGIIRSDLIVVYESDQLQLQDSSRESHIIRALCRPSAVLGSNHSRQLKSSTNRTDSTEF